MSSYTERNPNTMWKEEFEADLRDFVAENTVGEPTEQEIADLPTSVNLLEGLPRTYDQGNTGQCTAFSLTHIQLYQNCGEFDSSLVEMNPVSLWINMGHDPKVASDRGDYLENALKASTEKGISGTGPDGKNLVFLTSGYAFKNAGDGNDKDWNMIKYYLSKGHPIYTAIKGTAKTRREMLVGEVITVFGAGQTTGGHAVAVFGIDNDYLYFANSRSTNPKSTFKISRTVRSNMVKSRMANRRYWIVYDKKDITVPALFTDYYKDEQSEEYKAIKRCKDTGIIKGSNGKLLPKESLTREQMGLLLYRFAKFIATGKTSEGVSSSAKPTAVISEPTPQVKKPVKGSRGNKE